MKKKALFSLLALNGITISAEAILNAIFDIESQITVDIGLLVLLSVFLLFVVIYCGIMIYDNIKNLENENKKLKSSLSKNSNLLSGSEGDVYLLMALSQSTYEPLKIELLKKSAYDYRNLLAVLILSEIYKKRN